MQPERDIPPIRRPLEFEVGLSVHVCQVPGAQLDPRIARPGLAHAGIIWEGRLE